MEFICAFITDRSTAFERAQATRSQGRPSELKNW